MTASRAATRSMICARFSEPDEWAAEIIRDRDLVQREIARVTKTARPAMDGAATRVHIVASAIVEDRIIILETYVGDLWGAASGPACAVEASGGSVRYLNDEGGSLCSCG